MTPNHIHEAAAAMWRENAKKHPTQAISFLYEEPTIRQHWLHLARIAAAEMYTLNEARE